MDGAGGLNATIEKFGYPGSLVADYEHWVVLLRPAQPTLGSLVLAAKSEAESFGTLPAAAHAELSDVTRHIETALAATVRFERLNYLMLMMVDRHVHFHVLPRHDGSRSHQGLTIADDCWPKPHSLATSAEPTDEERAALLAWLKAAFDAARS